MRINPKKTIELISLSIKGDRNSWTQKTQEHILRGPYWNENKRRKKNYKFWCEVFYGSQRFLWTCTLHTHTLIYTPMESLFVFYITKNQSLSRVCVCPYEDEAETKLETNNNLRHYARVQHILTWNCTNGQTISPRENGMQNDDDDEFDDERWEK